eukprot:731661-Pyramimonas_sp.AAC.1
MVPRDLRGNTSKAVVALHASTLKASRLAFRLRMGWSVYVLVSGLAKQAESGARQGRAAPKQRNRQRGERRPAQKLGAALPKWRGKHRRPAPRSRPPKCQSERK